MLPTINMTVSDNIFDVYKKHAAGDNASQVLTQIARSLKSGAEYKKSFSVARRQETSNKAIHQTIAQKMQPCQKNMQARKITKISVLTFAAFAMAASIPLLAVIPLLASILLVVGLAAFVFGHNFEVSDVSDEQNLAKLDSIDSSFQEAEAIYDFTRQEALVRPNDFSKLKLDDSIQEFMKNNELSNAELKLLQDRFVIDYEGFRS